MSRRILLDATKKLCVRLVLLTDGDLHFVGGLVVERDAQQVGAFAVALRAQVVDVLIGARIKAEGAVRVRLAGRVHLHRTQDCIRKLKHR